MLVFNSIRKYTLALLDTFKNLKVQNISDTDNIGILENIPIKYSQREKFDMLKDLNNDENTRQNYNILPRSFLKLTGISKNTERQTSKFTKINTTEFGEFNFNAVAYDFNYDFVVMCRGMNECSMIIEQVCYRFNPTYSLLISEVPNQCTPTIVPVVLNDVSFDVESYEETSQNIITITFTFTLKGNFYFPISQSHRIKRVDLFLNYWKWGIENEFNRVKKYEFDVQDGVLTDPRSFDLLENGIHSIVPKLTELKVLKGLYTIKDIENFKKNKLKTENTSYKANETNSPFSFKNANNGENLPNNGDNSANNGENLPNSAKVPKFGLINSGVQILALYDDKDNQLHELKFIWSSNSLNTKIQEIGNGKVTITNSSKETIKISCICVDIHGHSSNVLEKEIEFKDISDLS